MGLKLKVLFTKALIGMGFFFLSSIFIYINYIAGPGYKSPVLMSLFLSFLFLFFFWGFDYVMGRLEKNPRLFYGVLGVLLFGAFLLKLYWINSVDTAQVSDFLRMWESAGEIASGNFTKFQQNNYLYTYPHLAFTTLFYALVHKISGGSLYAMKLVNVLISTGSCVLIYFLSSQISGGKKAVSLVMMGIAAPFIFFNSILDSQNLAIPFFYGGVLVYMMVYRGKLHPMFMLLCGALLSVGNLFRGVGLIFVIAIAMHWLIYGGILKNTGRSPKGRKKLSIDIYRPALLFFMLVSMWGTTFLFNQIFLVSGVFQKPTWETDGTLILYINAGLNYDSNGMWNQEDYNLLRSVNFDSQKAEILAKESIATRLSDRNKVLDLMSNKFRIQWGAGDFGGLYWSTLELSSVSHSANNFLVWLNYHFYFIQCIYSAMIMAIGWRLLRQWHNPMTKEIFYFGIILFVGFVLLHSIIEMQPRYGYVVMPMLVAMAGASFYQKGGGNEGTF